MQRLLPFNEPAMDTRSQPLQTSANHRSASFRHGTFLSVRRTWIDALLPWTAVLFLGNDYPALLHPGSVDCSRFIKGH